MKKAKNVQGIVARVDKFAYVDLDDLMKAKTKFTLVFLGVIR